MASPRKHWSEKTFVVTATSSAYANRTGVNRYGYCRECKGDMQSFDGENFARHYNSHKYAKRAGVWFGKR